MTPPSIPSLDSGAPSVTFQATGGETARLAGLLYDELRALARGWFRYQPKDHTLQPTALVHEAYLRLSRASNVEWRDRAHFFAVASTIMRRILVSHARERRTARRGGGLRIGADVERMAIELPEAPGVDVLALDAALTKLAALDERQSRIVELRFLGGLTVEETASYLGVSPRTVKLDWSMARAWLLEQLRGNHSL